MREHLPQSSHFLHDMASTRLKSQMLFCPRLLHAAKAALRGRPLHNSNLSTFQLLNFSTVFTFPSGGAYTAAPAPCARPRFRFGLARSNREPRFAAATLVGEQYNNLPDIILCKPLAYQGRRAVMGRTYTPSALRWAIPYLPTTTESDVGGL